MHSHCRVRGRGAREPNLREPRWSLCAAALLFFTVYAPCILKTPPPRGQACVPPTPQPRTARLVANLANSRIPWPPATRTVYAPRLVEN